MRLVFEESRRRERRAVDAALAMADEQGLPPTDMRGSGVEVGVQARRAMTPPRV